MERILSFALRLCAPALRLRALCTCTHSALARLCAAHEHRQGYCQTYSNLPHQPLTLGFPHWFEYDY